MKKYRSLSAFIVCSFLTFFLPLNVFANSSWHWLTDTRPYYILPFAIIVTLAIETLAIKFIAKVPNLAKTFCFVTIGNLVSFLIPYAFTALMNVLYSPWATLLDSIDKLPYYNVGVFFLVLTVIAELPIVYFTLRKHAKSKLSLILTVVSANVVTTGEVALIERLLCYGEW